MRKMPARQARNLAEARIAAAARRITVLRPRLVERFAADLRELHDALERTGLCGHYWVWSGLLLGWAREGAILPHDSLDADFGVDDRDFFRLVNAVPAIVRAGFKRDRRFISNNGDITELTFLRHGASFDFFRMFPDGDRMRYFMYSAEGEDGAVEVESSIPAQPVVPFSFLGRTWLKHADHERELREMYGSWEIPDPGWSYLEGPHIEARRRWQHPDFHWRGGSAALTDGPARASLISG
jgi:hypothetical protein